VSSGTESGALRVLVVEDEWLARNYLVELLQGSGLADVVAAVATVIEAEQALAADSSVAIDVAFVDVQLAGRPGDEAGLDWVRKMARAPGAPRFVLATAFKQHALEAYELGVADYVVKPFTEERVGACLRQLVERQPAPRRGPVPQRIVARRQRALVFLDLGEVWACEASDRLTCVHSARGRFDLDLTLSSIASSFGRSLVRVHRNWLVNPARVLEMDRATGETTILVGESGSPSTGLTIPVSRDRAQAVRDILMADATGVRRP
jgi:DNA-binding LytR/AlgR family response regulator